MNENQIPPWNRRDNFSVEAHQRLVDAANSQRRVPGGPFEIYETPFGGAVVDPRDFRTWRVVKVKVTAISSLFTAGFYDAFICRGMAMVDTTSDTHVVEPMHMDVVGQSDCLVANMAEDGINATDYAIDPAALPIYHLGILTGKVSDGRLLVEARLVNAPVLNIRYDTATHSLQLTRKQNPSSGDWVTIVSFAPCGP
jgi:hypothetical protein